MRKAMLLLAFFGLVSLAWAADPFVGTWKEDMSKTKISTGASLPKSVTAKVEAKGEGFKWVTDMVLADGQTLHMEWEGKFDGKDYPVKGDQNTDTYSLKKIDSNTIVGVDKKAGKEVGNWRYVVSKDGKTVTATGKFKNEKGQEITVTSVSEKQ